MPCSAQNAAIPSAGRRSSTEVLYLMRDDGNAGRNDLREPLAIEIREPDVPDLARTAQIVEPRSGFHVPRHLVVPPVKLHQIESVEAETG